MHYCKEKQWSQVRVARAVERAQKGSTERVVRDCAYVIRMLDCLRVCDGACEPAAMSGNAGAEPTEKWMV